MQISTSPQDEPSETIRNRRGSDLSLWALIGSNLVTIVWALIANWSLAVIIWVYWVQSVTIGILWFFKILSLKEFSTKGFKINERSVEPTRAKKKSNSVLFPRSLRIFPRWVCGFPVCAIQAGKDLACYTDGSCFRRLSELFIFLQSKMAR